MTAPDLPPLGLLAYLDPGSGMFVLQMIAAGAAGLWLFLKYQGRRFLGLFGIRPKENEPTDTPDEP